MCATTFLSQVVSNHDDATFSIADVVVGGGDPTCCAMDEGLAPLF